MRRMTPLVLGVAVAALATAAGAQQALNERRPAARDGVVEVSNVSGSVRVDGWEREEVEVTGTLGRGSERLEFSGSGPRTVVKVVLPDHARNVQGSDLTIHVPAGSRLETETVSADIAVDGVDGALDLRSVSGDIAAKGAPKEVRAESVSGKLEIQASAATMRAKSVSGDVVLRGVRGEVEASAVSGGVRVSGSDISRGDLETTSGNIRFDSGVTGNATLDIKTVSGSVELLLPADVAADFHVTSFSGGIENELGPAARRTSEYGPGKELEFSTGSGGAKVSVQSFSGGVRLRKR